MFGQFGTFPVQYLNFALDGLSRGTAKDRAEFLVSHSAMNMAIVGAGAELFDADLTSWATFGSLSYTGGPYAEAAVSMFQAWGGSDMERALALRNLKMMLPTIDSPQSVFVPGSYAIGDLVDAFQEDDLLNIVGEGAGIRFLRPRQDTWAQRALGFVGEIGR